LSELYCELNTFMTCPKREKIVCSASIATCD
jgi:hypothetical protein